MLVSLAHSGTPDPSACAWLPDSLLTPSVLPQPSCVLEWAQSHRQNRQCRTTLVFSRKVYEFLSTFIVTGMRFLLSQQVQLSTGRSCGMLRLGPLCVGEGRVVSHPSAGPCPASAVPHPVLGVIPLSLAPCLADLPIPGACQPGAAELFAGHSAWCVLPWERDWILFNVGQTGLGIKLPDSSRLSHTSTSSLAVRNYVDEHIGIDYSLLRDPSITTDTLELDFKVNTGSCLAGSSPSLSKRLCQQAH